MCTIGCMYQEQVDGPGGYDDTAMAVEQPSRADRGSAATEYVPAPLAIQKRLLVCQKGKGGGGRRAASGPRCAAARPCWLADREDEGRATYREGPSQTAPLLAAVGWAPVRASPRRAALRCASCLACLYLLAELAIPEPEPGSASTLAAAMRAHPASGSCWRNPAPGSQTAHGEWQAVIRDCKPGKPCSCCLALPCLHAWLSPGAAVCLSHSASAGQGKARQDKTRLRQHRRASLAESNGMPNFTWLAAGAPWAVDWRGAGRRWQMPR